MTIRPSCHPDYTPITLEYFGLHGNRSNLPTTAPDTWGANTGAAALRRAATESIQSVNSSRAPSTDTPSEEKNPAWASKAATTGTEERYNFFLPPAPPLG